MATAHATWEVDSCTSTEFRNCCCSCSSFLRAQLRNGLAAVVEHGEVFAVRERLPGPGTITETSRLSTSNVQCSTIPVLVQMVRRGEHGLEGLRRHGGAPRAHRERHQRLQHNLQPNDNRCVVSGVRATSAQRRRRTSRGMDRCVLPVAFTYCRTARAGRTSTAQQTRQQARTRAARAAAHIGSCCMRHRSSAGCRRRKWSCRRPCFQRCASITTNQPSQP